MNIMNIKRRERKNNVCKKAAGMLLLGALILNGCSARAAGREASDDLLTAGETAECVMNSLKELDLERFNACTDNYVSTRHNWIGVPVKAQYRVFQELLQPGIKWGKRKEKYEFHHELAVKMLENLTWEIERVEEEKDRAQIEMEITNLDMADVVGLYEISVYENMIASGGTGLGQMIKDLSHIADEEKGLLAVMEERDREDTCTTRVTVMAYREEEGWKLHLDEAFINAFMGNWNADEYSDELQQRIEELERLQEQKLEEWTEDFTGRVEDWFD